MVEARPDETDRSGDDSGSPDNSSSRALTDLGICHSFVMPTRDVKATEKPRLKLTFTRPFFFFHQKTSGLFELLGSPQLRFRGGDRKETALPLPFSHDFLEGLGGEWDRYDTIRHRHTARGTTERAQKAAARSRAHARVQSGEHAPADTEYFHSFVHLPPPPYLALGRH